MTLSEGTMGMIVKSLTSMSVYLDQVLRAIDSGVPLDSKDVKGTLSLCRAQAQAISNLLADKGKP